MATPRPSLQEMELDDFVRPFEEACEGLAAVDLREFVGLLHFLERKVSKD